MAIYHLEAKVVSRGAGRSAVAASAMASSKTVGTALRNKDDLDAVLASLDCFEREVSRSVEEINNIMCNRARIDRESER